MLKAPADASMTGSVTRGDHTKRHHAVVERAAGLIPFGHLGCGFSSRADLLTCAAEYIADGLAHNQRIEFSAEGSHRQLQAELASMPGLAGRFEAGDIGIRPVMEFYALPAGTDIVDPQRAIVARVAAVDAAIAHGYSGLRSVVDATVVAQRPEQRDALARFEFLVDQKMAVLPFSALCAYNTGQLGKAADGLLCLHPYVSQGAPSFRLHAQPDAAFALSGYVDPASDDLFTATMQRIWWWAADDPLVIDARDLKFISHQQLYTLDHCARIDGRKVILRTDQPVPVRLAGLLDLANVHVESPVLPGPPTVTDAAKPLGM